LRGPQTVAEVLARTERIAAFPSADDVRDTLQRLMQRDVPLVVRIDRAAGQREDRYMHLLAGPVDAAAWAQEADPADGAGASARVALSGRVEQLEREVEALRGEIAALRSRIGD